MSPDVVKISRTAVRVCLFVEIHILRLRWRVSLPKVQTIVFQALKTNTSNINKNEEDTEKGTKRKKLERERVRREIKKSQQRAKKRMPAQVIWQSIFSVCLNSCAQSPDSFQDVQSLSHELFVYTYKKRRKNR